MRQNGNTAKLCVRKTVISSSIQAQGSGDFMSQKWRSYGLSDTCHAERSEASLRPSIQTLSAAKGDKQPVRFFDRCPGGSVEHAYLQMSDQYAMGLTMEKTHCRI
jgi:hypothetical protein